MQLPPAEQEETFHHYHRFMHFVEAADSTDESQKVQWEGVTRRKTAGTMMSRTATLDENLAGINSKLELLDEGLTPLLPRI